MPTWLSFIFLCVGLISVGVGFAGAIMISVLVGEKTKPFVGVILLVILSVSILYTIPLIFSVFLYINRIFF